MLVTKSNFDVALREIRLRADLDKLLSTDSETTCLPWWDSPWYAAIGVKPRVFAAQISTATTDYYFDFHHSADKLGDKHFRAISAELTEDPELHWFIANAKFDLHHFRNHGVEFKGRVHCTKAIARVANNLEPSLSLDELGLKYLGVGKLDVISLLKERKHFTMLKKFGHNDKFDEVLHFDRLELKELVEYGEKDTRLCFDVGVQQIKTILQYDQDIFQDKKMKLSDVMTNEQHLTKVFFEMEREGILIDRAYTEAAYEHEVSEYLRIERELDSIAKAHADKKIDWLSAKQLKPLFEKMGEPYTYTEKGNASFDKDALEDSGSELAKLILKYRHHNKRAHTYFENFIWLADRKNYVHADSQQGGTQYGRTSYWSPNLQNVPKRRDKDEAVYKVRACFIPDEGAFLADFDYDGAEYFLTMDYAKELPVIEMLKAGLDPHTKLKDDMGLKDRDTSKTMQFRILYGAGGEAVGKSLGLKGSEAKRIGTQKKFEYFERMPAVADWIKNVQGVCRQRGYIFNWFGRLLKSDRFTAYKGPNNLIQSGVGDMTKKAQVDIYRDLLQGRRTKMLLQVHDSLLFKMYPEDLDLVPLIKKAMCDAYPHKLLPMSADVAFSKKSWAHLSEEIPGA